MLRDEPTIRPSLYRLPRDPVAEHVLVPAFRQALIVRGAFGWFSAGWISRLAHGLAVYLARTNTDTIKFTIAPALFPLEYDALKDSCERTEHVIHKLQQILLDASSPSADNLSRHALDCLTWMVIHDRLELRIAKVRPGANYHPKMWLFCDGVDKVAVRGSANATGRAYSLGVEHMDVDCTWENRSRVDIAMDMLNDWSEGRDDEIEEVLSLPDALHGTIKKLSPSQMPTLDNYEVAMNQGSHTSTVRVPQVDDPSIFHIPSELKWNEGRYAHQGEAVRAWESAGRRGVIAMATGAGKTISALISAYRLWQEHQGPLLIVISAPSTPLLLQWNVECSRFGLTSILPTQIGTKAEKFAAIGNCLYRLRSGKAGKIEIMIITNNLLSTAGFNNALRDAKQRLPNLKILHIGDEAHTLGSESFIKAQPDFYDYRLGLSATPVRQYDDEGTAQLFTYFGHTVYEFGLDRAIGFCLVPYDYHVHITYLNETELKEFKDLSVRIGRQIARAGGKLDFSNTSLTSLFIRRRAVTETADGKFRVLQNILLGRAEHVRHTLVYTSSKNPDQLDSAIRIVADSGFVVSQVTENETRDRAKLERILNGFSEGEFDILVAKRVLDEGVDIPQTREAIFLASSSVEREWIQRRGRVLRPAPKKDFATLHDVISLPPPQDKMYEDNILQFISSELDRVRAFARHARNHRQITNVIADIHKNYFLE